MKKIKGFTLIEIMIALTIMVALLGISLTYSRQGTKQIALFKERARVMQEISRARSLTATLLKEEGEKVCGYGIYFTKESPSDTYKNKMILYKDLPPATSPDSCPIEQQAGDQEYNSGEAVDEILLDPQVQFCDAPNDIFFLPPKPDIFFDGQRALPIDGGSTANIIEDVEIELCLTVDTTEKSFITVNLLGQISSK